MALFQSSVLKKYLHQQDKESISKAYKKFSAYFHNPKIQENIRESKEEQFQEGFLRELFVNVLGYILNPKPKFDLTTEFKNERGAKKADGAILKEGKAIGVIELKGTDTKDLDKVRQQAFDYKANQTNCIYVITSNFEKLRFYIDNAVEFEEFNLFELNEERFRLLYLCLANQNVLNNTPQRVKTDSLQKEEAITKEFYSDYSIFKRELFRDLVKLNMKNEVFREEINREDKERASKNIKLALFKKSQKLIDRYLFIFFAEDRGLLPPNSTLKILHQWNKLKELDEIVPLYSRFIKYFNYLDQGRKGTDKTAEIFAYNGGLFKPDPTLDSLTISDELLYKHAEKLSNYDFESQVDVNILGHIFENSLNEIESINAEIEGKEFEKQKTKRKKDGVFYTPKYITKYIVDNTLGKLCEEKKDEIGLIDEEYTKSRKGRHTKKLQELSDKLNDYRNWLLGLKICDPACGSGAFLNQALDFLIKEHAYLDELNRSLLGGGFLFPDIENTILEKNIYGVDINEESVEIAKLSLWLRTAQPRRKLNDLSNNIKCGNSLISNKTIAGIKAFDWKEEFVEVFKDGGFDVVIGNPPYVNIELIPKFEKDFYNNTFKTFYKRSDLFVLFLELAINKLTKDGMISFIVPSIVLNNLSYRVFRDMILKNRWLSEVCYTGGKVFADATVDTVILTMNKSSVDNITLTNALNFNVHESKVVETDYFLKYQNAISVNSDGNDELFNKLFNKKFDTVEDHFNVFQGIVTGNNKSYIFENIDEIKRAKIDESLLVPIVLGRDIGKWKIKDDSKRILYINSDTDIESYPSTKCWLEKFKSKLEKRRECIRGVIPWYSLQWPRVKAELDKNPKILLQRTRNESLKTRLVATIDDSGIYGMESIIFLTPKSDNVSSYFFLAILNSKLLNYLFATKFLNLAVKGDYLKQIKFPVSNDSNVLSDLSKSMILMHKELLDRIDSFNKLIQSKFSLNKLSNKLQNWNENNFQDFINDLEKLRRKHSKENEIKYIKLSLSEESDWMNYFSEQKQKAEELKTELRKSEKKIDELVYNLYGLSDKEIEIVETY